VPDERVFVVPLAARPQIRDAAIDREAGPEIARHYGLGERYLAYAARFDARHDLRTMLAALASFARARPSGVPDSVPWPPRVVIPEASPEDRASIARLAARLGVGHLLAFTPGLADDRLATLLAGARAVLVPAITDAAGLGVLDGLAVGVPIVATAVDGLPELVGDAGVIVPPGEPDRLVTGIAAVWADDRLHARLAEKATASEAGRRTWVDVAGDTRAVYAAATGTRP
jgi:glycosyltransferase involved in cell wall biosynthesis